MGSGYQTITIRELPRSRPLRKLLLFIAPVVVLAWYTARTEWDYYGSYSGVVVEKGMDCNLCLLSDEHNVDLYIILRDEHGRRSKRYLGTNFTYTNTKRWNAITVGTFVIKDRGFGEFPYEPGRKPAAQPAPKRDSWILWGLVLVCGTALAISLRQLWKAL